jgi:predicted nucleotidyltransferase
MIPSKALKAHKTELIELARQYGAANIRLFGSVLRGTDNESSDLDLLVDMPEGATLLDIIGLEQSIGDCLGVTVEVLTDNDLPESFREDILREARPI